MTSTQTSPAEAPPPVDLRPHTVAYLANNLRTNGYEHHARTMEALAELRAVAEPSAEEAAALYRASMTETKGGFTEAIHHFARVLLSRYGAHKPDGGDAVRRLVDEKFTSGNVIPVERITITRTEWDAALAATKGESNE